MRTLRIFLAALIAGGLLYGQALTAEGVWFGTLEVNDQKLRVVLRVKKTADAQLSATLDSLDQGALALPADDVSVTGDSLRVEFHKIGILYEAKILPDGKSLAGELTQGQNNMPLNFTRTTDEALAAQFPKGKPMTDEERKKAIAELERTRTLLDNALKGVTAEQSKFKPAPDKWSVFEITEHLAIVEDMLRGYIFNNVIKIPPTAELRARSAEAIAAADAKVMAEAIDRSKKTQTMEPLKPTGQFADLNAALAAFHERRAKTIEIVTTTQDDLRNHAANGMDGYEYLLMLAGHTQRHVAQIEEVKAQIK
jgi:hypothetical protein